MSNIKAIITGVGTYVPDYILTNDELSTMMDTSDEWIMTRIGIKERHILKGEGLGTSDMGAKAVNQLLEKTNTKPEEIDALFLATVTPDMQFPASANIICDKVGIKNIKLISSLKSSDFVGLSGFGLSIVENIEL